MVTKADKKEKTNAKKLSRETWFTLWEHIPPLPPPPPPHKLTNLSGSAHALLFDCGLIAHLNGCSNWRPITCTDPEEGQRVRTPLTSQNSILATIGRPVERHLIMAFRWRADSGPLKVVFGSSHQLKTKKKLSKLDPS